MASTYIQEHNRLFGDLTAVLGRDLAHLSTEANGGRSILFVYPPVDEEKYIEEAKRRFAYGYEFIDLRLLFVEFVDSKGLDKFKRQFKNSSIDTSNTEGRMEAQELRATLTELQEFCQKVDDLLASGYDPKLDDGVGKNIAPLQKRKMLSYEVLNAGQLKKYLNADW